MTTLQIGINKNSRSKNVEDFPQEGEVSSLKDREALRRTQNVKTPGKVGQGMFLKVLELEFKRLVKKKKTRFLFFFWGGGMGEQQ